MKYAEWKVKLVLERDSVELGTLFVEINKDGTVNIDTPDGKEALLTKEDMNYIIEQCKKFMEE
jgi:hypothetical protein